MLHARQFAIVLPWLAALVSFAVNCGQTDQPGTSTPDASGLDASGFDGSATDAPEASADAAPDAVAWSPAQLTGLALWLESTSGVVADPQVPTHVARWKDKSGNGNDAVTSNNGVGISLVPNAVNGLPALLCGAQAWFSIVDSASLHFGTGDYQVAMVVDIYQNTTLAEEPILDKGGLLRGVIPQGPSIFTFRDFATSISVAFSPKGFQLVFLQGKQMSVQVGPSTTTGANNGGDISTVGDPMTLCPPAGNFSPQTSLAAVLAIKGTVSPTDRNALRDYLNTKYGL
jgi:hypothetical protein